MNDFRDGKALQEKAAKKAAQAAGASSGGAAGGKGAAAKKWWWSFGLSFEHIVDFMFEIGLFRPEALTLVWNPIIMSLCWICNLMLMVKSYLVFLWSVMRLKLQLYCLLWFLLLWVYVSLSDMFGIYSYRIIDLSCHSYLMHMVKACLVSLLGHCSSC